MKPYTVEKMKKILEGNSTYIQEQLILSGLFMLVFESFKDYAVKAADFFLEY